MHLRQIALLVLLPGWILACRDGDPGEQPVAAGGGATAASGGMGGAAASEGGGGSGGLGVAAGPSASLVTWNVESFPLTGGAVAQAAGIIAELAPDLLALQEIRDPQAFDDLLAALPAYDGVLNVDPGGYLRLGLLHRRERVVVSDVETLFPDDWYAFPRPPLKARVTITDAEPVDFLAVVIHLKAQLDAQSEARRRAACEVLDDWVAEQLASGPEPDVVLLGDFNDKLTDPPQWNVFTTFLDQPDQYRFLTQGLADAGQYTYIPFKSMIDHVLVTTDLLDEIGPGTTEVLALEIGDADYGQLTDHRPVRTWLHWGQGRR